VTAVAFVGPDTLVAASLDGALRVWRGSSVEPAQTLSDHRGPVTSLAASPREDLVATGGADGAILLWDVADGALRYRATLSRHVSAVLSLAFTADASFLWSASLDRTAEKWTLARLRAVWHVPPDLGVVPTRIVALSTSRALAGTAEGDFRRLGPDRGAVRLRPHAGGPVSALGPAPDAAGAFLVAAGDGALRSLDPDALGGAGEWRGEALRPGEDGVEAFAAAPDGGRLFLCGAGVSAVRPGDATVLWRTFLSPRGSATFAGDGRFFATGDGGMLVAYGDGAEVRGIDDPAVRNMGEWASTSTSTSTAAATNGEGADPGATTTTGTGTATATATGVNGSGGSGAMGGEE
jgi:WD40 repeat protein